MARTAIITLTTDFGLNDHFIGAMKGVILGIAPERVSVKATTNERLGFVGREEGIAAIATASVVYPGGLTE